MSTQEEKFKGRFNKMKENGLVDLKFFHPSKTDLLVEDVCRELNDMTSALDEGNYSEMKEFGDRPTKSD